MALCGGWTLRNVRAMRCTRTLFGGWLLAVAAGASLAAHSAAAQEVPVDVELVLAVDVSLSMDADEQAAQRAGYVAAFRDATVLRAIAEGPHGAIAVAYLEWAGAASQQRVVDWHLVRDRASAEAFAAALEAAPLQRLRRTSISAGLQAGAALLRDSGFTGIRRVIDVSGDGANNQGGPVTETRDRLVGEGIVINGLPLNLKRGGPGSVFDMPDLDRYYAECVIGGPGAFSLPVRSIGEFAEAIRRKLVLEIAALDFPLVLAAKVQEAPMDCLIGEKMWRMRMERYTDP
jgi:hypothetical protein